MKKVCFVLFLLSFVVASSFAHAQTYQIGADVALKVQYFRLMDKDLHDFNAENGIFVGIEAYKQLFAPNLYFGVETGWAGTNGDVTALGVNIDSEVTYVPIEFNAKYVIPLSQCLNLSLGGGISYNFFNLDSTATINVFGTPFRTSLSVDDWVFGGQFFAGLDYKFTQNLFAGIGVKYQLTEDLTFQTRGFAVETETSADNLRVGMQIGYMF